MAGEDLVYKVRQTHKDTLLLRVDIHGLDFLLQMARVEVD